MPLPRRFLLPFLLLLALASSAPAQAQVTNPVGQWYQIGTDTAPINHDVDRDATQPAIAALGAKPIVAYEQYFEAAPAEGQPAVGALGIRAAWLEGGATQPRPWKDSGAQINKDFAREADEPDVAVIGDVPYVAWSESDGVNLEVRVARWTGAGWEHLGNAASPVNDSPVRDARGPSIVGLGGVPYVAYSEIDADQVARVRVKAWNGTAWEATGGTLNVVANGSAVGPSLADVGGTLYVAWEEHKPAVFRSEIEVKLYSEGTWYRAGNSDGDGDAPISEPGANSIAPSLVGIGTKAYVAWHQNEAVHVESYDSNAGSWSPINGQVQIDDQAGGRATLHASIANVGGVPFVAYIRYGNADPPRGELRVRRPQADGSGWEGVGGVLNSTPDQEATPPDMVGIGGTPTVTWSEDDEQRAGIESGETDNANKQVYVKAYGIPPFSTGMPQISGVPQTGRQLSCTTGQWNGAKSFTILWQRGVRDANAIGAPWKTIDGALGATYTVQAADEGSRVRCLVIAAGDVVSAERGSHSLRTDADVPAGADRPTVVGSPIVGDELECMPGEWTGSPDLQYQWFRTDTGPIAGATAKKYKPRRHRTELYVLNPDGDGDRRIGCGVIGVNDIGSGGERKSLPVRVVDGAPYAYEAPKIKYTTSDANPLRPMDCSPGRWYGDYVGERGSLFAYGYQWRRNGAAIAGAVQASYTPTTEDYGRRVTCVVENTNPAGRAFSQPSNEIVVELPTGAVSGSVHRVGGYNPVDPTNLLAISDAYMGVIREIAKERLDKGVEDLKADCAKVSKRWPRTAPDPASVKAPVSEETRCRVLLYAASKVSTGDSGARYLNGRCTPNPTQARDTVRLCPDLEIKVPPIDPTRPPTQDADVMQRLANVTPKRILWDIDEDGVTDAACPGSAPVLRTIYDAGRWKPRAVILNMDDKPSHFAQADFVQTPGPASRKGKARPGQVKVCATSFDPPRNPTYPCVTAAQIGRVAITDANLCPISERQITPEDFVQLLGDNDDAKKMLLAASEAKVSGEGARTASRSPGARTHYVDWDEPTARAAQAPTIGPITFDGRTLNREELNNVRGAAANNVASLVSTEPGAVEETSRYTAHLARQKGLIDDKAKAIMAPHQYSLVKGQFATSQIYVSKASMAVNGILNSPVGDTAMLLLPSEIKEALPNVKEQMALLGRNVATQLGADEVANAIPLATGGQLKSKLRDHANGAAEELMRETNLTAMVDDARKQGAQLAKDLERKLDIKPFKLFGGSKVTLNKDGSATLHAHVNLPGLTGMKTGGGKGEALGADITITADQRGNVKLDGIKLQADYANLGLIELSKVYMEFTRATGLDVRAKIMLPAPLGQGIDLRQLKLGPDGQFQRLWLAWQAGPGGGLALGGSGLFLTEVEADINVQADQFKAGLVVGVGQAVSAGCPAIALDADLEIRLARPFHIDGQALAKVLCVPLAGIHFRLEDTGLISLSGWWDIELGPIWTKGSLGAAFKLPEWQVWLNAAGGIRPIIEAKIDLVLSSKGLAGCGSMEIEVPGVSQVSEFFGGDEVVITIAGGGAVGFVRGRPPTSFDEIVNNVSLFWGCDIGRYYPLGRIASAAQAGGTGSATFSMPRDAGPSLVSIEGAGGSPKVRLKSPSGKVYDLTSTPGNKGKKFAKDAWGAILETEDRTVAIFGRPEAGTWTAETADSSPAVVRFRRAEILPPVGVRGRVTGKGTTRTLSYDVLGQRGQQVRFLEVAKGGQKVLKTVSRGGKGSVRFTVGEADSRTRRIYAEVTQSGLPRKRVLIARYTAANATVGRVGRLKIRRQGSRAVVTWTKPALAGTIYVQARYGSGDMIVRRLPGRARRFVLRGVARGEGLRVQVRNVSPSGRDGRLATARLSGSMRVGAVAKTPKYDPAKTRALKKKLAAKRRARANARKRR